MNNYVSDLVIDDIFLVKTGILVFRVHPQIFCGKTCCLKNISIHSLTMLNFVYIVVFDVEKH